MKFYYIPKGGRFMMARGVGGEVSFLKWWWEVRCLNIGQAFSIRIMWV